MFGLKSFALLAAVSAIVSAAPVESKAMGAPSLNPPTLAPPVVERQSSTDYDPNFYPNDVAGSWPFEIVNKWRALYDLPQLEWSEQLHLNAIKTVTDCGGAYYQHELNPGSYGQVLAFGVNQYQQGQSFDNMTPFELTFLGGWMCERPDAPALGGNCPTWEALASMDPYGQTGHVDIITDPSYKTVGCGFFRDPSDAADAPWTGMWGCDFGY